MVFKKLIQLLEVIDPVPGQDWVLAEKEARALLFPNGDVLHFPGLSVKQQHFFGLLAEARAEYVCRKIDVITNPTAAGRRAQLEIGHLEREHFLVMCLNGRNHITSTQILFSGTTNRSPVFPREVVRHALLKDACAVILAHNHPSQDVTPSQMDLEITERLWKALALVDIPLLDHLIVSAEGVCSLQETHPHLFG